MGKTLAEMTADEKNAISHRGAAVRQLAARIARRYGLVEDNY
jgi:inosine/xanthosine triphosphate pyrophosphatase family protein